MAKEVSGFHLQVSLDIGEFFGIPREDLVSFFPEGTNFNSKFTRVDWEPFARMTSYTCSKIGHKEDLIPAGQKYTYERIGTRFTHLMTQFGGGWDRVLWSSKHFFTPRLIHGYKFEYEKLGHNHFRLISRIPDSYAGCEAYFWLFSGIWTGGNKISNLKHQILRIDITPHGADGEIRFAERNRASKVAFNAPWSRLKTWRELKQNTSEQQSQVEELGHLTRNLQRSVEAVSDAVYRIEDKEVYAENMAAATLLSSEGFHVDEILVRAADPSTRHIQVGNRFLELRTPRSTSETSSANGLLVLRDRTEEVRLQQEAKVAPQLVRRQTGEKVSNVLGHELAQVSDHINSFVSEHPTHPATETLQRLSALAVQCQTQANALVDHRLRKFRDSGEWLAALEELSREYRDVYGYQIIVNGEMSPEPETAEDWSEWFLICREAFRNAYRHSGGGEVRLEMETGRIRILDDGSGLRESFKESGGLGCASMCSRAKALGWSMQPAAQPLNGWTLEPVGKES